MKNEKKWWTVPIPQHAGDPTRFRLDPDGEVTPVVPTFSTLLDALIKASGTLSALSQYGVLQDADPHRVRAYKAKRAVLDYVAALEACELQATVRAGTSFALGHDGDEDRRPYVLVARAYGSRLYPIPPWTVHDVDHDRGVITSSVRKFHDQTAALEYGWQRLAELRDQRTEDGSAPQSGDGSGAP